MTSSAPSWTAAAAASIAVLPPPTTPTRRPRTGLAPSPSRSASPVTTGSSRVSASTTPSRPSPGTPRRRLRPRPSAEEDGVVLREQLGRRRAGGAGRRVARPGRAHPRAAPDLDAGTLDLGHLVGGHVARMPPRDDAVRGEPAGLRACLEDRDVDALAPQLGRAGEARRTRANDRDPLADRLPRHEEGTAGVSIRVHRHALEGADLDRPVEGHAHAGALAQAFDRADAGTGSPERVRGEDGPGAAVEVAGRDRVDEPGHVDARGARGNTRRVVAEEAAGRFLARSLQAQPGLAFEHCHRSSPGGADGRRRRRRGEVRARAAPAESSGPNAAGRGESGVVRPRRAGPRRSPDFALAVISTPTSRSGIPSNRGLAYPRARHLPGIPLPVELPPKGGGPGRGPVRQWVPSDSCEAFIVVISRSRRTVERRRSLDPHDQGTHRLVLAFITQVSRASVGTSVGIAELAGRR